MRALTNRQIFVIPTTLTAQKILYGSLLSGVLVFSVGLVLFAGTMQAPVAKHDPDKSANAAVTASSTIKSVMSELNIANSGLILLRGARVTEISADKSIGVEMTLGGVGFSWILKTNNLTKFFANGGKKTTFSSLRVGDTITVTGHLAGDEAKPEIEAEFIRVL